MNRMQERPDPRSQPQLTPACKPMDESCIRTVEQTPDTRRRNLSKSSTEIRKLINEFLHCFLKSRKAEAGKIDFAIRIANFVQSGKFMRANLVEIGFNINQPSERYNPLNTNAVRCAAALELMHSALLIHDDIIDRSGIRRGSPSWHVALSQAIGTSDDHLGTSLAICAGNLGYFWAYEILSGLNASTDIRTRIETLVSSSIATAGVGEMQELFLTSAIDASECEIEQVYKNKTALYSCSLPLITGATLAGADIKLQDQLEDIGQLFGFLFQLIDDELDLFGDSDIVGKPIGNDVREGRKTILYTLLRQMVSNDDWALINRFYGSSQVTEEQLCFLQKLINRSGTRDRYRRKIELLSNDCQKKIKLLPVAGWAQQELCIFLSSIINRQA